MIKGQRELILITHFENVRETKLSLVHLLRVCIIHMVGIRILTNTNIHK